MFNPFAALVCGVSLVPSSDSESESLVTNMIRAAGAFATRCKIPTLHVVHVLTDERSDAEIAGLIDRLAAAVKSAALEGQLAVELKVLTGPIAKSLAGYAEVVNAGILMVAARNQVGKAGLGKEASELTTLATIPVVVVRDANAWIAANQRTLRALIGVDHSAVCDVALSWLAAVDERSSLEVVLTDVYYPDVAASRYGLASTRAIERNPAAEELLVRDLRKRFANFTSKPAAAAIAKLGLGRIGDHIIEAAEANTIDVVVVGTSQKTGIGKLGSVSSAVIASATQSVICVPPTTRVPARTARPPSVVVVATDGSHFANRAIPHAYALCSNRANAAVHMVQVVDEQGVNHDQVREELLALVPADSSASTTVHLIPGDSPAQIIAMTAARVGADAICIASHGRTGIARALVGSVADQVLRETRLPVMVIRPSS